MRTLVSRPPAARRPPDQVTAVITPEASPKLFTKVKSCGAGQRSKQTWNMARLVKPNIPVRYPPVVAFILTSASDLKQLFTGKNSRSRTAVSITGTTLPYQHHLTELQNWSSLHSQQCADSGPAMRHRCAQFCHLRQQRVNAETTPQTGCGCSLLVRFSPARTPAGLRTASLGEVWWLHHPAVARLDVSYNQQMINHDNTTW